MARETPLDPPSEAAARDAAADALDADVASAAPIEAGLNATYRVDVADGRPAVLKVATLSEDAELLVESRLLERLAAETAVPVPPLLAVVPADAGPLPAAAHLTAHREGRQVAGVLDLPPAARERLVREAGRHLAALHELDVPDRFGPLVVDGGTLAVPSPAGSWPDRFAGLAEAALAALGGDGGFTADADPRFADLAPVVRDTLGRFEDASAARDPDPAVLYGDYRPANLVLDPADDAAPLTRTVLDVATDGTVDGALDCALAEVALVDGPLGGTPEARRLRDALRSAYAACRSVPRERLFDARYPYYRLFARVDRMGAFGYWHRFAREDDPDAVAARWRAELADCRDAL